LTGINAAPATWDVEFIVVLARFGFNVPRRLRCYSQLRVPVSRDVTQFPAMSDRFA
jgi:hypothetical protein